jgi:predicted nucleotidyltransferase
MASDRIGTTTQESDETAFVATLHDALGAVETAGLEYLLMGGIGSAALGRPRYTHDIDLFVKPDGAGPTLDALAAAGFETERTDPHWLYKAFKRDAMVDVIFRSAGEIYLDDEMLAHASVTDVLGCTAHVISPEDLLVIKAVVADEHIPRHWYDALGIVARCDLDWDYLQWRALQHGTRRVLSLLLYAQSNDIAVPIAPLQRLFSALHDS